MKFISSLCLIIAALILSGCATVYRDRDSIGLAASKMAVLEEPSTMDSFVYITEVNGRDRGTGLFSRFELPPGRNSIVVIGNSRGGMHPVTTELVFHAEEGKTYVLKYETSPNASLFKPSTWNDGPGRYRAWIIEKATGKKVDLASLGKEEPIQLPEPTAASGRGSS